MSSIDNAIFETKLKDTKHNTYPVIISCIIGGIFLKQNYAYATDAVQESTGIINILSILGPPTLLTAVEIYKIRGYIKKYIENLKLYSHET